MRQGSEVDTTPQGGLGHVTCPLDPIHRLPIVYQFGKFNAAVTEAVRVHMFDVHAHMDEVTTSLE